MNHMKTKTLCQANIIITAVMWWDWDHSKWFEAFILRTPDPEEDDSHDDGDCDSTCFFSKSHFFRISFTWSLTLILVPWRPSGTDVHWTTCPGQESCRLVHLQYHLIYNMKSILTIFVVSWSSPALQSVSFHSAKHIWERRYTIEPFLSPNLPNSISPHWMDLT